MRCVLMAVVFLVICSSNIWAETIHVWNEIQVVRLNPGGEASSEKSNIKMFDRCTLRKGATATDTGLKFEDRILWFVESAEDSIPTFTVRARS